MGLSLEERKRRLIENVCDSCSGGGETNSTGAGDSYSGDSGVSGDYGELMKGLNLIKKMKKKRKQKDGT